MKHIAWALILSISLHLIAIYFLQHKKIEKSKSASTTKIEKKSNIHYVKLQSAKTIPSKKKPEQQVKKSEPKKVQTNAPEKIVKETKTFQKVEKIVKQAKRKVVKKEPKKISKKPVGKISRMPDYKKLNPTKLQKQTLDSFLSTPAMETEYLDKLTQSYIKEYGDEFNTFTQVQKAFIKKNLRTIEQITASYFRFPKIAIQKRLQGRNVVEFTLYPNGDMTGLRIKTPSEYAIYDSAILETIEIAFKDYPRPTEPTKIIFYLTYTVR